VGINLDIHQIGDKHIPKIIAAQRKLRPGQILQGKVLKLYPGQKAQIQLGSNQLTAQLEASLSLGATYHFQVQRADQLIHLKILGEQLKRQDQENVSSLLKQLGLQPTKSSAAFLHSLINNKIPFDRHQLHQALHLLKHAKEKVQAGKVLTEMINRRLPITDSVFQALLSVRKDRLSDQMNQLLQQMNNNNSQTSALIDKLSQLMERPLDEKSLMINQIIMDNRSNQPAIFQLLKTTGMIPLTLDFNSWKSQWDIFSPTMKMDHSHQKGASLKLPFQLDSAKVIQTLQLLRENKNTILMNAQDFMQQWGGRTQEAFSLNKLLTNPEFSQLTRQFSNLLLPLAASSTERPIIDDFPNNPNLLRQILAIAQTLSDQSTYTKAEQFLTLLNQNENFLASPPDGQLITQIRHTLSILGLSFENELINNLSDQQTIKEMLLQLISESEGSVRERAVQLLHFINGMQLNSVQETDNFIQASLFIPGEKLQLNSDLELEFEGRKTEKGEINPDFCRILFYLELSFLGETIVDMNIQNRGVAVTVYNDTEITERFVKDLKPLLKEGLNKVDYYLTGISFKSLKAKEKPKMDTKQPKPSRFHQGVDYRI